MDITKYTSYFHDGELIEINHVGDNMEITMVSCEMFLEDVQDDLVLSEDDFIKGKLHLEWIKSIKIDEKPFTGTLKKIYDMGGIFHFKIKGNTVELQIIWVNFKPILYKDTDCGFSTIEIEAEKIYWENIPDLNTD